ncbi:MAG: hypothetical protein QM790_15750 [Nibricoccus sp.]
MADATPARSHHGPESSVLKTGRGIFWAGAGFCTLAAPWMLGGMPLSTQWWLLGGAITAFVGGLIVRFAGHSSPGARAAFRVQRWALGLGLLFIAYLFLQAINPSLAVVLRGNMWDLQSSEHSWWGPHSISAPFDMIGGDWLPYKNAWRYLLIYGTGWLFAAGLCFGLTERKDALRWVQLVAVNGFVIALVCLAHKATGSHRTLWLFADTFDFTGSPVFFYKNHNGAYLALSLAAILGVAAAGASDQNWRVWEIAAIVTWAATVVVNSRVAIGCATFWFGIYGFIRWRHLRSEGRAVFSGKSVTIGAALALALGGLVFSLGGGKVFNRFSPAFSAPLDFLQGGSFRSMTRQVGWEMWKDDKLFGWGGGSFMYLFQDYHQRVPEIARTVYRQQPNLNRFVAPGLNCDWVEFLVEYGVVGVGLLVAAGAVLLIAVFRWRENAPPQTFFLTLGVLGLFAHAYLEYLLRNPAILLLALGSILVAVRLAAQPAPSRNHRVRFKAAASSVAP